MLVKLFTLDGIRRRADKTVSLTIRTATEQTSSEMMDLDLLFQRHVLVAIKPDDTPFLDAELSDISTIDVDLYDPSKSQSKRIRGVIWRNHEQELGRKPTNEEFAVYYNMKTEQIIEHFKTKLD